MLIRFLPFLAWFRGYRWPAFRADLVSGITVALVLIPQSMAYARLAGLPAHYGLYASFLPPMIAALFGSSRQLATGPVAIVSLMTAASLAPLATRGGPEFIAYAVLLALTVGIFQFLLGVLRLGLVVNFLSHPVVNGFTNGAALIIATSQLSKLFGVQVDDAEHHYETIAHVISAAWHYTHWPTLLMGALAFAVMYGLRRLDRRIPYVLAAVVLTTAISWAVGFEHNRTVALDRIESPELRTLVRRYNEAVGRQDALGEQRTALNGRLAEAEEKHGEGSLDALLIRNDLAVVNLLISQTKEEVSGFRAEIRGRLLAGVPGENGGFRLVPQEAAGGRETDDRTWRIRVGQQALDPDNLVIQGGGAVVGALPQGLPSIGVPKLDVSLILRLLPAAIIISLLGFMEAISIAKAMAAKTGQRLDPNQELIGQGLANIMGSMGQSYPTSGSFSRSAVNLQSGAATGMSSVVTSIAVVIVLFFFTPLLFHLPQAVLAAVIMMAVVGLLNVSGFVHAWRAKRFDGAVSVLTFVATLGFAPHLDKGILVGVGLSLAVFLYKSMRPKVASLSLHERTLRDAAHFGLGACEHVAVVRFDGPLFFANASYLEDKITERIRTMRRLRHILVVAGGINDMDASGEESLSLIVDRVRAAGYGISLCEVKERVLGVMRRTHLLEKIGRENLYDTLAEAVATIHPRAHEDSEEERCPLVTYVPVSSENNGKEGL